VSSEFLPSIRFYDRVSSTVLNSYVGPKLSAYLDKLVARLREIEFGGVLLVMQSNGGVMSPEVARTSPGRTLLSGPAAAPEVVTFACALLGVTPPPEEAFDPAKLSPMARTFYADNKRVSNARIKSELGVALAYPDYRAGLTAQLRQETGAA